MSGIFENLQYPFVFVDGSHVFRTGNVIIQKLTRNLLKKDPQQFWALIDEIENYGREDSLYYDQIIQLQKRGIISSLITCEAVNQRIIDSQTDVIHIFGAINSICLRDKDRHKSELPDLVLWGENMNYKTYIRATNALLSASCIVADKSVLSLQIGQLLLEHTTQHCPVFYLSGSKKGGKHTEYDLPPKQFIQQLVAAQRVTD